MKISKNYAVYFDYEVRNSRAELLDSSQGSGPMAYVHGYASIIPGLEKALEGKSVGEELQVIVPPADGYGLRDENRVGKVDRSIFPKDAEIKPGMRFRATSEHGTDQVVVTAVDGDTITVDANHPLAGEALTFQVSVRDVRPATDEEVAHGHVHHERSHEGCGCGGHDHNGHDHEQSDGDEGCCGGHGGEGCGCQH